LSHACPRLGLVVSATLLAAANEGRNEALVRDLNTTLEANGLLALDRGHGALRCSIGRDGAQVTDDDRQLVLEWANRWADVASISVSDLVDLDEDR
jgi:YggL 50S ribosome-binding protein